jgi:hypothetical protein
VNRLAKRALAELAVILVSALIVILIWVWGWCGLEFKGLGFWGWTIAAAFVGTTPYQAFRMRREERDRWEVQNAARLAKGLKPVPFEY